MQKFHQQFSFFRFVTLSCSLRVIFLKYMHADAYRKFHVRRLLFIYFLNFFSAPRYLKRPSGYLRKVSRKGKRRCDFFFFLLLILFHHLPSFLFSLKIFPPFSSKVIKIFVLPKNKQFWVRGSSHSGGVGTKVLL